MDAADDWPPGCPPLVWARTLPGGRICDTREGELADGRHVVVKSGPFRAEVEADGLRAMAAAGAPVPGVLGVGQRVLVLEYVDGPPDWAALGRAIARMHRSVGPAYGWHLDNSGGETVQRNRWYEDWPTFYVENRIRVHLEDPSVPGALRDRLERACRGPLPELLPAHPPPSLTHGDLWVGNVVGGRWLIDPAVSYADRELDLAFMERSRSLPPELFEAYHDEWPLEAGYAERRPALQLHKMLNNLRHFGVGIVPEIEEVLDHYGW